jgi:hypothetical protein
MSPREERDPVKPALIRAEAELAHHLDEACEDIDRKDLSQESMDELLRLEDDLLSAARALREAVRLRRRLGEQANPERYLGEYFKGWLAFESLEGDLRKRLPNHPADWFRLNDAQLARLLPRAVEVQKRTPRAGAADTP